MNRTLLARSWVIATILGLIGLIAGVMVADVLTSRASRFTAQATLAMLPGPEVPAADAAGFWEVLNHGQATRSAALVIDDQKWLGGAAAAAGVPKRDLDLSAGAVPDTTLITVSMKANSAGASEKALDWVLANSVDPAAKISGPFVLDVISSPDGSAVSMAPNRAQMMGALGVAGMLVAAGAGLLIGRTLGRRPPPNADKPKHASVLRAVSLDQQPTIVMARASTDKIPM